VEKAKADRHNIRLKISCATGDELSFVGFIHELGHFVAARSLGLKVSSPGIGLEPEIIGYRREASLQDQFVNPRRHDIYLGSFPVQGHRLTDFLDPR
jgi:hypothetical protein